MMNATPEALEAIRVDDALLEVRRWPAHHQGVGDPILLLHEGLGSISSWRDFPARLMEVTGRNVIAWSRRGYGWSDPLPDARAPDYMHAEARLLPQVMDRLGVARAVLFGHSDGGSIALIAAALMPDLVSALILEAPHVMVEPITVDSIAAIGAAYRPDDLGVKLGRHHADPDRVFRQWNDIWLDPRFRDWTIEDVLPDIAAPALLIQGLDDEYGTLDQLDRVAVVLPRTERLELSDCGHSPHRDRRDAVLAASRAFLESR
jgi:pimeloyl-ACP methyl ester carboxylesterase